VSTYYVIKKENLLKAEEMKSFVQVGATATLSWLLWSTTSPAASLALAVKPQSKLAPSSTLTIPQLPSLNDTKLILGQENTPPETPSVVKEQSTTQSRAIASVLPADTPVFISITTKPEVLQTLYRFQLFQSAASAAKQLLPFIPSNETFDLFKDVNSWLGEEIVFAFLPKTEGTTASIESHFLILAPIKDQTRLQPLLDNLKDQTEGLTQKEYKGTTILEFKQSNSIPTPPIPVPEIKRSKPNQATVKQKLSEPESEAESPKPKKNNTLAIASLPGYIAVGITAKPIEQLIDNSQTGNTNLAENPQYQLVNQHPQANQALLKIYENPVAFVSLFQDIAKEVAKDPSYPYPPFNPDVFNVEEVKLYSSIGGLVFVQPEGMRFQVNGYRQKPTDEKNPFTVESETIINRIPAATYTTFTGLNLNLKWQILTRILSTNEELKKYLTSFRDFVRDSSGLDVDKDILEWMDGEYAFFLYPTKGGFLNQIGGNVNLGIGVAIQTKNRQAADSLMEKLDKLAASSGGLEVKTRDLKGQSVTSWEADGDSTQSLIAYSWLDNDTILITSGFGAITDLVPQPYVPLPKTYNFTTATNSLPRPNQGYYYMNMGSFLSWAYGFIPGEYGNNEYVRTFKEFMGSVYSVSATNSTTPDRTQFDMLVVLAPTRKQE
jgi:hypothetical protein